jgi:hypothetical protein
MKIAADKPGRGLFHDVSVKQANVSKKYPETSRTGRGKAFSFSMDAGTQSSRDASSNFSFRDGIGAGEMNFPTRMAN